jgi:hypothetical protein
MAVWYDGIAMPLVIGDLLAVRKRYCVPSSPNFLTSEPHFSRSDAR